MRAIILSLIIYLTVPQGAQAFCLWNCAVDHGEAEQKIRKSIDAAMVETGRFGYAIRLGRADDPIRLLANRKKLESQLTGALDCAGTCRDFKRMKTAGLIKGLRYEKAKDEYWAKADWTDNGLQAMTRYEVGPAQNNQISVALGQRNFIRIVRSHDGEVAGIRVSRVTYEYEVVRTPWGRAVADDPNRAGVFGIKSGVAEFSKASDGWHMDTIR